MKFKILGAVELLIGLVFLFNSASDIQLGFGLVLIALGIENIIK